MGHVWRGFSEEQISAFYSSAGFSASRYHPLPPDEAAKGPVLFAAVARRTEARQEITGEDAGAAKLALTA
jgi:hypothetical protein